MTTVGAFDAKTHLNALLRRVSKGEVIRIPRRGVPIAKLVPAGPAERTLVSWRARFVRFEKAQLSETSL